VIRRRCHPWLAWQWVMRWFQQDSFHYGTTSAACKQPGRQRHAGWCLSSFRAQLEMPRQAWTVWTERLHTCFPSLEIDRRLVLYARHHHDRDMPRPHHGTANMNWAEHGNTVFLSQQRLCFKLSGARQQHFSLTTTSRFRLAMERLDSPLWLVIGCCYRSTATFVREWWITARVECPV
jgi:hypothetical protein